MGLDDNDEDDNKVVDEGGGGGQDKSFGSVPCSICLEVVADNGDRSWAKLLCGHRFHLDCVGSAFNIKGAMQCPNCRKIEKGQWLYANGSRSYPEFTMDDWAHDEDFYDLSYTEMSFGVHWCPFGNLTRLPSSFEEGEFSSTAYHDIVGQHAMFAEQTAVSSAASHPCPYVAYFGPVHPSSSNSGGTVSEASNYNHWNGSSVPSDMTTSYAFPAVDLHYHNWEHHSPPFSTASSRVLAADQPSVSPGTQRPVRGGSDVPRYPFLVGHSSAARAGSSVVSPMIPPYPGSNARARDRVQALQAYYQPQQPPNSTTMWTPIASGTRRSSSHSGSAQIAPVATSPDQNGGFFFIPSSSSGRNFQEDSHLPNRVHAWERDSLPSLSLSHADTDSAWRAYHQAASRSDSSIRSNSFRLRPSDRMPPQNR
ncbi:hypothetical protein TanjilG_17600 [Lupinus angustifolius]|uniref:RING-type domain-containing protein n=1 Tax=Lupinus angustifolius TaxID=3871 RepID=A0A1J7HJR6_LUPAN|nr:PREDICTED: uncharacterized protein LOC109346201 [Lupinus angustifolius]OIW13040.1 hypothetical protein TanjilG_17600 [Lupinus angustifolius]